MKTLCALITLLSLCIYQTAAAPPDSLIIRFGNGYRLAVYAPDAARLATITRYDVNQLLKDLLGQLAAASGRKDVALSAQELRRYLRDSTFVVEQAGTSVATIVRADPPAAPKRRTEPVAVRTTGQTLPRLTGLVRDSLTNLPLAGAAIIVDYRKNVNGTITDSLGQFSLSLTPGTHTIVARLIGYSPARKEVAVGFDQTAVVLTMRSVATQLEEVFVTTKGYDETVRQPLLGVNQINLKTLQKLPAALGEIDLLRGLQSLPGVTSVGEASNGVNIRGGTTDQNLILLDDTPIFNPTHMFGLFSIFPPEALSTVDIYKGNVPARFGGRTAAVLDVALRNPNLDNVQLSGGVNVVSSRLSADIPLVKGKAGLLIAGRGAFTDFLLPIVSKRLTDIRAKFGDGVLKGFWRINNRNTLTAMGYISLDAFQTPLLANLPNVTGSSTQFTHQTLNLMGRWFHALSDKASLQTSVVWAQYTPEIRSKEVDSDNLVRLRQSLLHRQIKSNLNIQLPNQKVETGLSATHYQIEPGTLLPGQSLRVNAVTTPTEYALELGLYADYEVSLGPALALSAGLRYSQFLAFGPSLVRQYRPGEPRDLLSAIDSTRYGSGQVSKTYGGAEPRFGLRYALSPNASLKIGYNLMRQYVQVVTNTTTPLPTSRWKTADANIRPQVSQLITAGYFLSFKNNIYELTAETYWRHTQNVLDYRPGADFLLQPNPETQLLQGQSQAYGLETMLTKKKGELTGWVNYTYARTLNQVYEGPTVEQNINGGQYYRANYDRPHSLNASITIDVDKHNSFGFTFAYSTGRPYTAPTGFVTIDNNQYPYYGERNQARLPDYHRLDFAWNIYNPGMRDRRWQGRWAFTVYNVYGRSNPYSIFFRTEAGKTNAYQLTVFGAPIVSLAYTFIFK
ncbi:TonB-dependent receptor [Fibrella arboris]|uniref:TonB-dependent receptor n=1 Tax=Fibrella arboris TaxID=3242486 RepID=UPI00352302B8